MIFVYFSDTSPLDDDIIFQKYYEKMSEQRKKKTDAFAFRKDKNLCVGAGILLDYGLIEYRLKEVDMKYGVLQNGKPYFEQNPSIRFNVSHSGTKVMVAFSDSDIGCDIEKITDIDMDIAKRYFHKNEYSMLTEKTTPKEKSDTFFRLWTLKESFLKATGFGMTLPLNSFEIRLSGSDITVSHSVNGSRYYFKEFNGIEGYKSAVCTEKSDGIPIVRNVTIL